MFEKIPKKPLQKLLKLSGNEPVEFYGEVYKSIYGRNHTYKKPIKMISFPEDHGVDDGENVLIDYKDGKPLLKDIKKILKNNFDVDVDDTYRSQCVCTVKISGKPNDKIGIKLKTNQNYTDYSEVTEEHDESYSIPARFWNILPNGFKAIIGTYSGMNDDGQYNTQDIGTKTKDAFMIGISEIMPNLKLKYKKENLKIFEEWLTRTEDRFLERTARPNFNNEGSRGTVFALFGNRHVQLSTGIRDGEFIKGADNMYEEII
jgi:hypothetical protein|tara:strand:- start:940 stop:1719 length:780 start_codon:yes stop_codon:yes gene_type:complete